MQFTILAAVAGYLCSVSVIAWAATFTLPENDDTIVGRIRIITDIAEKNTLLDIMRHFDLGYAEITAANPGVSSWVIDWVSHALSPKKRTPPGMCRKASRRNTGTMER